MRNKKKHLKTNTGKEITVRLNDATRTATIWTNVSKYKTLPLNKEEWQSVEYWTGNDWNNFLKTDQYYNAK
jgi:hypothetical protein